MNGRRFFTDYPFLELDDTCYQLAPIRELKLLSWDGDKYVCVEINETRHILKRHYVYTRPIRFHQLKSAPKRTDTRPGVISTKELCRMFGVSFNRIKSRMAA
jgi:hypothetical protein